MWGKLSIVSYLASLTSLLMMLFRFNPFNWSNQTTLFFGVYLMGLLGFIFSIFSNFFDPSKKNKTNKTQTFIFYIGMIIVFTGLFSMMQQWPYTLVFFGIGLVIMGISFFIKLNKSDGDKDILDS